MFVVNMFWYLLLAHVLGDYPLQTDWMVKFKTQWYGLALHILTHTATIIVVVFLVGGQDLVVLHYLITLLFIHLAIDLFKNRISAHYPDRFVQAYFFDQLLHLLSILGVAFWMSVNGVENVFWTDSSWILYLLGLVLITDVWRITERVFSIHKNWFLLNHKRDVLRMVARAGLFMAFLSDVVVLRSGGGILALAMLVFVYWCSQPERCSLWEFRLWWSWRLLMLDITIAIVGAILISYLITFQTLL